MTNSERLRKLEAGKEEGNLTIHFPVGQLLPELATSSDGSQRPPESTLLMALSIDFSGFQETAHQLSLMTHAGDQGYFTVSDSSPKQPE